MIIAFLFPIHHRTEMPQFICSKPMAAKTTSTMKGHCTVWAIIGAIRCIKRSTFDVAPTTSLLSWRSNEVVPDCLGHLKHILPDRNILFPFDSFESSQNVTFWSKSRRHVCIIKKQHPANLNTNRRFAITKWDRLFSVSQRFDSDFGR